MIKHIIMSSLIFSLLLISLQTNAQVSCDKLFESFKQGARPNCASIAVIKASLNIYGLNNLFTAEKVDDGTFKITLKNGATFNITQDELAKAKVSAGFVIIKNNADSRAIIEYAEFAYGVMAKYMQILDKETDFDIALKDLEQGAYTPTVYKYLGFEKGKQIQKLKRLQGGNDSGIVAWSNAHAVFACGGYMDYHGSKDKLWLKYSGRFKVINK